MLPHIKRFIIAAFVLVLCHAAVDQGSATVVRDGKNGPANPAVEAGGHHPMTKQPPAVPYSLIGALGDGAQWCMPRFAWPWRMFDTFPRHSHSASGRFRAIQPGDRLPGLPPLP
jgi:hypothetical protein